MEYHLETMEAKSFSFEAIFDGSKFIGVIAWWQFDTLRFIEHLATLPAVRGEGYGERILHEFASAQLSPIILEVEHPTCEMSRRRIGFYERNGFALNDYPYSHPPYHTNQKEFVSLMLMSYPRAISASEAEDFKRECYSKVHFRYKV